MSTEPRFERPPRALPGPRQVLRDLGPQYAANGLIGLIFAATGPIAVILAAGVQGGLGGRELASWLFGVFFANGLLTVLMCWVYRQPLGFFWTIPGTVLVGQALGHLSLAEVVGAYLVTGLLMLVLGLSGWIRTAMAAVPMPIVMAMVAGVFLGFGTGLVDSVTDDGAVAVPMIAVFVLLAAWPAAGRRLPPVLGALLAGVAAVLLTGSRGAGGGDLSGWVAAPLLVTPAWSWQAMVELVLPLAITVLVVQNGQGVGVLRAVGHRAPVNVVTAACGLWSILVAGVGAVSTCLTGPTNALLTAFGTRERQYTAGIVCGILAMVFGLFAPVVVRLMLAAPPAFLATLGGLAMLKVLQSAFVAAFGARVTLSALVTFVVTVSGMTAFNIGAPFWGLVAGVATAWLLERDDLRRDRLENGDSENDRAAASGSQRDPDPEAGAVDSAPR
ncbi:benzoate membrane transport protein [Pseudonocardia ammonioxydans]|uniref:Benzoate membrane transport protein n=1 Tax=Pseudonocardia ammonioxydans TaxID=260086 RepID=A0A1I4ZTP3_PSUAM|nr:benzoate/H(+) symporter BenE family transporter [Pseudonocardia ammonioxydans]SFN53665.1 benzoate membrane transport protein [Pseudonocardia ammonioxydans]